MENQKKMSKLRFWSIVWGMGIAGQLCWNMENQWFNTFVYAKISGNVNIVTWMVIVSALVTTISTFVFGTWSDRIGKRRIFVSLGYIIWGATTILFGLTGTGYFDMVAYEKFNNGQMTDYVPTDDDLAVGFAGLPEIDL